MSASFKRLDRNSSDLRQIKLTPNYTLYAEGSVLVEFGSTKVLCTATVDSNTPKWLAGTGKGWVTAEYGMLPRSTHTRMQREKIASGGRTQEISRLIARALRASVDLSKINEKQIIVDCDVIQADGGTRTAAITGGFVALALALHKMQTSGQLSTLPLKHYISAVSIGLKDGQALVDLCYEEDSNIHTDMNFVLNEKSEFIEVQGTAEGASFNFEELQLMSKLAQDSCQILCKKQSELISHFFPLHS